MDDDSPVIPLAQLQGFRIANGALDMRLWQVHSGDGRWIGSVDELLVDTATMEVRYLDVEVENLLATGRERHVLIPVCHTRPDAKLSSTVVVDALSARAVAGLPAYDRGAVVHGADTGYVRPFVEERDAASRKLDLPIRVAPPRVVHAIRAAASSESAGNAGNRVPSTTGAGVKQGVESSDSPARAATRKAGSRAA